MNIVFLDSTGIPASHRIPSFSFPHQLTEYAHTAAEQVLARAKDADIIITSKVILDREILSQLPKLKLIAVTATGTNNIDLAAAKVLGIVVKNVTGYSSVTVPEHVIGMIYALKHRLIDYHRDQLLTERWATCGQFCYVDYPISDVQGSTLGIGEVVSGMKSQDWHKRSECVYFLQNINMQQPFVKVILRLMRY